MSILTIDEIDKLLSELSIDSIPEHIAIIMDGNRRWAKKNKLSSIKGHSKGAENLIETVKSANRLNIKTLTVFAFSTENWLRSEFEVKNLMKLFEVFLKRNLTFIQKERIKLNFIGDLEKCPKSLKNLFNKTVEKTKNNDKLNLVVAINYGSKNEITRAVLKIVNDIDHKKIKKKQINENLIDDYLDTKNFKDPDLLIRTSGEKRLSNFMLWQLSYTEIYVTDAFWPDFNEKEFIKALLEYQKRKRRLGGA